MLKKVQFLLVFISLSVCLCLMSSTYSRYVADAEGNIDVLFAKWQILVSNVDITTSSESEIIFVPVIEENEYVAANVMAPSSKGHFDIEINPTNVEVSFKYAIALEIENENIPDLKITEYAIVPENYVEGESDPLEINTLEEPIITNTFLFDRGTPDFQFGIHTIRVYFEWYEGENELMDDNDDTTIGHLAATEELTFNMNANLTFEQIIE
ncbi:MAG: hypothetical protein WDA21_03360 [Bacilli bacterium]